MTREDYEAIMARSVYVMGQRVAMGVAEGRSEAATALAEGYLWGMRLALAHPAVAVGLLALENDGANEVGLTALHDLTGFIATGKSV